ncbi:OsmC family protein [Lysinimonas soli]|uniref:OsmC family protein n=1 Tax=Lysinimonas soli TaxID=1074233 RepID=A0ABW0NT13_9MICO
METAPTSYTVHAHTTLPGVAEAEFGAETVRFDRSWASEPSGLPGPAELLAAAFSACLLKNLERAGQLLDFHYDSAEVEVVARRQDVPPRFTEIGYELRITTAEPAHRLELVHRNLRKFGTVYNTLAAVCAVDGTVVAVSPSGHPR